MSPTPAQPPRRPFRLNGWVIASILSLIVLIAGAGWLFWTRVSIAGPAVGEKVDLPPAPGRATQRLGEGIRNAMRPNAAARPAPERRTPPSTVPARN